MVSSITIHPRKLAWRWKIHICNRKYIFKCWIFQPVMLVFVEGNGRHALRAEKGTGRRGFWNRWGRAVRWVLQFGGEDLTHQIYFYFGEMAWKFTGVLHSFHFFLCWSFFINKVSNFSKINLKQIKLLSTVTPLVFTYQHSNTITTSCAWQGKAEGLLWRGVPKESAADRGENPSWYSELPIFATFQGGCKGLEV